MKKTKDLLLTSFAMFSLFFGAGNLLLPPMLGYTSQSEWFLVSMGFMITSVFIPILGIYAHAKTQGTLFDFTKNVSNLFGKIYCLIIYILVVIIPCPRTASATYEVAIQSNFDIRSLTFGILYFGLVLIFVLNRSMMLGFVGKYLTPLIVFALLLIIGISYYSTSGTLSDSGISKPVIVGLLEGYQTFDAIASVVVGAVVVISVKDRFSYSFEETKTLIKRSGLLSGLGLFSIYTGLIVVGAFYGSDQDFIKGVGALQRSDLLRALSINALGNFGNSVLSLLFALACFTTTIGIVIGVSDYFKSVFNQSQKVYVFTAIMSCSIGVLIGQLNFGTIIKVGFPFLLLIYPVTIVLIILNALPRNYASNKVFKWVVITTLLFSIPDVLGFLFENESINGIVGSIPLAKEGLGWCIPASIVFIFTNIFQKLKTK